MHSRASATTLKRVTYIFLSGNEFHLQKAWRCRAGVNPAPTGGKKKGTRAQRENAWLRQARARPFVPRVNKQRHYEGVTMARKEAHRLKPACGRQACATR